MSVNNMKEQEINELDNIANQLRTMGDRELPEFNPTKDGSKICEWEGAHYSVLKFSKLRKVNSESMARKLARFHTRGRYMPFRVTAINRIGNWKQFWEQRLDQLEIFWNGKLMESPVNEFEKMFIDSFPYYMGLSENAIQYLTDTELDARPTRIDHGTVCHERFTDRTWGKTQLIKNPFDWVFDHASRDLAEWSRSKYFNQSQTYQPIVRNFFAAYQQVTRLTPFSLRLLYARLLFPLHYFECIEDYYLATTDQQKFALEDKLRRFLSKTEEYEQFLASFYQLVEAPVRAYKLPRINWLLK